MVDAVAWLLDERTSPSETQRAYMEWWASELVPSDRPNMSEVETADLHSSGEPDDDDPTRGLPTRKDRT